MAVYKNGIEYDVSYQVEKGDYIPKPNTIERMSEYPGEYFDMDNTWLPYMKKTAGAVYVGQTGNNATQIWNFFKSIWLEFSEVPMRPTPGWEISITNCEQAYLKNCAEWTYPTESGNQFYVGNWNEYVFLTFFDEDSSQYTWNTVITNIRGTNTVNISWVPNGTFTIGSNDSGNFAKQMVVAANKKGKIYSNSSSIKLPEIIYINEDLYELLQSDSTWMEHYNDLAVTYNLSETQWLENHLDVYEYTSNIRKWYESDLHAVYGKYLQLNKNGNLVKNVPYWKENTKTVDIGANLTESNVTRTGEISLSGETINYSVTLGPCERSFRLIRYINTGYWDGESETNIGAYSKISVWPFQRDVNLEDEDGEARILQVLLRSLKRIRYRKVGTSEWTYVTIPTREEMYQNWWNTRDTEYELYRPACRNLTANFSENGYYEFEYNIIFPISQQETTNLNGDTGSTIIYWNDTMPRIYDDKINEAEWTHAWMTDCHRTDINYILSVDYGNQWYTNPVSNGDDYINFSTRIVRDSDWQTMKTYAIHDVDDPVDSRYIISDGGSIECIVVDNIKHTKNQPYWFEISNANWTDHGILFWNSPLRFTSDWFMGVMASYPKTIYLHSDIYNMTNNGFDDNIQGWELSRRDDFLNNGGTFIELPNNWKELVPDYCGD